MTRACFMCGDRLVTLGGQRQWGMMFFWDNGRRFMVRICIGCFVDHEPEDIWWMLKSIHTEEGREIGQGP